MIVHNISHRDENCETRRMGRTKAEAKHEQNSESAKFYFYWLWHDKVPFVKDILASKNKHTNNSYHNLIEQWKEFLDNIFTFDMPTNYNHTLYVGSSIDSLDKYLVDRRKLQIISNKLKAAWNKM